MAHCQKTEVKMHYVILNWVIIPRSSAGTHSRTTAIANAKFCLPFQLDILALTL